MSLYVYTTYQEANNIYLKIASDELELNLSLATHEAEYMINNIHEAIWEQRKAIKAGLCLGMPVFWCCHPDQYVLLLIGEDDETWEIALRLPLEIIAEVQKANSSMS